MVCINLNTIAKLPLLMVLLCFSVQVYSTVENEVNLEQLKSYANDTTSKWLLLQQALDTASESNTNTLQNEQDSLISHLRQQYERARTEELIVFDRLIKKEAELDYKQYLAERKFEVDYLHQCDRMSSRRQCEEKARVEVLNKAGKQGSSIIINSTTDITTVRTEASSGIANSSEFKEQTNMRSFANIISYDILESHQKHGSTEYQRLWFIKIQVHVSAKRNESLYQQILDKHKERFESYLSANSILHDITANKRERYVETIERVNLVMIKIPSGQYQMGSDRGESNERPVQIKNVTAFYMSETEVTKALYDLCIQSKICKGKLGSELSTQEKNQPQADVSWYDIQQDFLPWLSLKTGRDYRLPTEVEWEYAARADSESDYFFGDNVNELCTYANAGEARIDQNRCDDGHVKKVAEVKQFQPNEFGLFDILGNVSEWTSTCWHLYGKAPMSCNRGTVRGGSWYDQGFYLRSASRKARAKNTRLDTLGFRLVYSD
ncbi:hypothetical protein GCM10008107_00590 [Psychrosphaera saromensis]|uniref:formylglycine-generating enzyme family protein n=1 Tax=Psychrosphaera saromensis TaxID=716813 RepID=UPI0015E3137D|nr:SUMF1/EgtB/PvdO family nonheme iron enzyme [Psychrosphaera saromensis]GHB55750.1 hypothetical protein GCM10008107_00590 [Psychrosphaera saromensis]GLQ13781.1 hypothetical protein GCM10007917_12360 [Psychrosphaera saromensis]